MLLTLALVTATALGDPKPLPAWRLGLPLTFRNGFHYYRPRVEVWTNKDQIYARGERVRVYFRTDIDAYVTVLRVDTDGRVRVLFPRDPWEDAFVRGAETYETRGRYDGYAFEVSDYPGVGYVFAIASADPFRFDPIVASDHWDYRVISGGRIHGDPYVELTSFAQRILPGESYADWDYDMAPYYVERQYDYPRFLCYDCHGYVSYRYWDPYRYSCVRFRMVIYDDPFYYPYRYYRGTRVVFVRPARPEPRFIFKDRSGSSQAPVVRVAQRPVDGTGRRDPDRGVTGRDLGRVVDIPNRRRPEDRPVGDQPDRDGRDRPDDRPDDQGRRRRPDDPPGRPDDPGEGGRRRRPDEPPGRPSGTQNPQPQILPPVREPRREEPRREEPRREEPRRQEPQREQPRREEPRREEPRRQEPRREEPDLRRRDPPRESPPPRAEPRRESPPPRAEPRRESPPPRAEPRAEPRRESPPPKSEPRREPERRRDP